MSNNNLNQKSSRSQAALILAYLEAGNTLASLEAINRFGCARLASRICDLRNLGHSIHSRKVTANGKRYAEYSLGVQA